MSLNEWGTNRGPVRFLTPEDYEKLLETSFMDPAHDYWAYGIVTGWNTGLKLGQIATLRWESVDLEEETLQVHAPGPGKSGQVMTIPLQLELYRLLSTWRERPRKCSARQDGHVAPDMARLYRIDKHRSLSSQFIRLCRKAGLEGANFTTFRLTLLKNLVEAGVDSFVIASVLGVADLRRLGAHVPVSLQLKRNALHKMWLYRNGVRPELPRY